MADLAPHPIVKELRISLVWAQALPANAAETWYERWWPADSLSYVGGVDRRFSLPWSEKGDAGSHFWSEYLETESKKLPVYDTKEAYKHLVPFRLVEPAMKIGKLQEARGQGRIALESYAYPHGAGVLATIYLDLAHNMSLPAAVTFAIQARRGIWTQGGSTLQNMAEMAMENLRKIILQNDDYQWNALNLPHTVTTFIDVEGAIASPVEEGGMIHRALQGLCLWGNPDDWAEINPEPLHNQHFKLSSNEFHVQTKPDKKNIVYESGRGQAVWFPDLFDRALAANRKSQLKHRHAYWLGRYHRNVSMAALQAGSLISLLDSINPLLQQENIPSHPLSEICRRAAGACGRMYGTKKSYNTWGTIKLIEEKWKSFVLARQYFWPMRATDKRAKEPIQDQ